MIAAIILAIGIVRLSRGESHEGQTIVLQGQESSTVTHPGPATSTRSTTGTTGATSTAAPQPQRYNLANPTGGRRTSVVVPQQNMPEPVPVAPGEPRVEEAPGAPEVPMREEDLGTGGDTEGIGQRWVPPTPLPADFAVTNEDPTIEDLNNIVFFLTTTDAPSEAKSRNIEVQEAIVVPQTVSRIGLFRAPRGGSLLTDPVRNGNTITVNLHAYSAGIPNINMSIDFVYADGSWRLAALSMCKGVKTVGLPIYCNA